MILDKVEETKKYKLSNDELPINKALYLLDAAVLDFIRANEGSFKELSSVGFSCLRLRSNTYYKDSNIKVEKFLNTIILNLDDDKKDVLLPLDSFENNKMINEALLSCIDDVFVRDGKLTTSVKVNVDDSPVVIFLDKNDFIANKGVDGIKRLLDASYSARDVLELDVSFKNKRDKFTMNHSEQKSTFHLFNIYVKKNNEYYEVSQEDKLLEMAPEIADKVIELNRGLVREYKELLSSKQYVFEKENLVFCPSERIATTSLILGNNEYSSFFWNNYEASVAYPNKQWFCQNLVEKAFLDKGSYIKEREGALYKIAKISLDTASILRFTVDSYYLPCSIARNFANYFAQRALKTDLPQNEDLWSDVAIHKDKKKPLRLKLCKDGKLDVVVDYQNLLIDYVIKNEGNFLYKIDSKAVNSSLTTQSRYKEAFEHYLSSMEQSLDNDIAGLSFYSHLESTSGTGPYGLVFELRKEIPRKELDVIVNFASNAFLRKITNSGEKFLVQELAVNDFKERREINNFVQESFIAEYKMNLIDRNMNKAIGKKLLKNESNDGAEDEGLSITFKI